MTDKKELSFEESVEELENIIQKLEKGDLNIDNAISEFKRGIKLYKKCYKKLEETEGEIKLILEEDDGKISNSDFEILE